MNNEKLVSVIIPTYNRAYILKRAIISLQNQDYYNIEIIVVDDGSDDGTKELIDSIKDDRIRYFYIKNSGACAARNKGILEANGEYITFLDSDDEYYPNKISTQLNQIEENNVDMVFCSFIRNSNGNDEKLPNDIDSLKLIDSKDLLNGNFISTQTMFGKTSCFRNELFDSKFTRFQDWDFAYRITKKYKVMYFDITLVKQNIQIDSIFNNDKAYVESMLKFIVKHFEDYIDNTDALKRLLENLVSKTETNK